MFVDSIATLPAAGNEARRLAEADGSGEDDTEDESASVAAPSKVPDMVWVALLMGLFPLGYYLLETFVTKPGEGIIKKVADFATMKWGFFALCTFSISLAVLFVIVAVSIPEKQLKDDDSDDSDDEDDEDMSAASQSGLWAKAKGFGALLGVPLIALVLQGISVQFSQPWAADGSNNTFAWFGSIIVGFLIQFVLSML